MDYSCRTLREEYPSAPGRLVSSTASHARVATSPDSVASNTQWAGKGLGALKEMVPNIGIARTGAGACGSIDDRAERFRAAARSRGQI
jgi:hypothetical protein